MKLIIADDDSLISDSLKMFIELNNDLEVIGTAKDGEKLIKLWESKAPDVILMDIRMPNMDGVTATKNIKKSWPKVHIVMLTTFKDSELIKEALLAGVEGYLLKSTPADGIVERIRAIDKGAVVLDTEVLENLYSINPELDADLKFKVILTQREIEILNLVAQGNSNKEISNTVHLSEGTVRNFISSLLSKLELRDRTQLAVYY